MKKILYPDKLKSENNTLATAINDYLIWMIEENYAKKTIYDYKNVLKHFQNFIKQNNILWEDIFNIDTFQLFIKNGTIKETYAITGLSRFLFNKNKIPHPITKLPIILPDIYEDYMTYRAKLIADNKRNARRIKRTLSALNDYLQKNEIDITRITIEHVDSFLNVFNQTCSISTHRLYRSSMRQFLRYLYYERKILKKDLSGLIVSPPLFARAKPPKFLHLEDIKKLFQSIDLTSSPGIRANAIFIGQ